MFSLLLRVKLLALVLALTPAVPHAESIVELSERTAQFGDKVQSLLFVGTSASHPDTALGNKQALIAAEMRKLLKAAGLSVFAMGIKAGEPDSASAIAEGVAKFSPTHIVTVAVPSGMVLVKRSTGETIAAKAYVVKTEVSDAKSKAVIWTHAAQVEAGFFLGASNNAVAEAVVRRMRADGLL